MTFLFKLTLTVGQRLLKEFQKFKFTSDLVEFIVMIVLLKIMKTLLDI